MYFALAYYFETISKACLVLQSFLTKSSKVIGDFTTCIASVTPLAVDLENALTAYNAGKTIDVYLFSFFLTCLRILSSLT